MSGSLSVGECLVVIPMTTGFYFFFSWSSRENMRKKKGVCGEITRSGRQLGILKGCYGGAVRFRKRVVKTPLGYIITVITYLLSRQIIF